MVDRPEENLGAALAAAYPELDAVRDAAGPEEVFLVGGAVRDLLLRRGRSDIDLVVIGDAAGLAAALGADFEEHERFATAKVRIQGHEIDIATAREEGYVQPGALPQVAPAPTIEADLRRRDFTVNAMALPLRGEPALIDPHGGRLDLEAEALRVLDRRSFVDDPTRALRAARYAARLGFELERETALLIRQADLDTVSVDRRESEMLRLAGEENAVRALGLLGEWGVDDIQAEGLRLAERVEQLLAAPPWRGEVDREIALLAAARTPAGGEGELPHDFPESPSQGVALARPRRPVELLLARARGAEWLDTYMTEWRHVSLEIDGQDLLAAGVAEGPVLGNALAEALRRKLDGEIAGREQELEAALAAAGESQRR